MILWRIALRNILATRMRTVIIGLLTVLGTALVVVGLSLLGSLEKSMASSVVGSVTGHAQIYSDQASDTLDLFGAPTGTPDLRTVEQFPKVKEVLQALPNIKAVIPMANDFAIVFSGNFIDTRLAELRQAQKSGDAAKQQLLMQQVRHVVESMQTETDALEPFKQDAGEKQELATRRELLAQAATAAFWDTFDQDVEGRMSFLENKIAPLALDESMIFLRYLGTDMEAFEKHFDRFKIVDGTPVPPGKRGFLFAKQIYERQVKHPVARRFDFIKDRVDAGIPIAGDLLLENLVKQNVRQYQEVLYQLDQQASQQVMAGLDKVLGPSTEPLSQRLQEFLAVDDTNFAQRFEFFYSEIAPHIVLYKIKIGDNLTIRAVTKSGYMTSVAVPVYGTYEFTGMEKSVLAGAYNLLDMMTFRDLYGSNTSDQQEELKQLVAKVGVKAVEREDAEAELFGEEPAAELESPAAAGGTAGGTAGGAGAAADGSAAGGAGSSAGFDEFAHVDMKEGGKRFNEELLNRVYTAAEMDSGVVMHAAVVLEDDTLLEPTLASIEAASKQHGLGIQAVSWKAASGLVGQFIGVLWAVLVASVLIIFLVALVIINNTMVMATLERTREIGTLRAMGASRGYVLRMFLVESSTLGLGFGFLGLSLGVGLILWAQSAGIPAFNNELYFLFGGPRLYPTLLPEHLLIALGVVLAATVGSTLYPAKLASSIAPVRAMERED